MSVAARADDLPDDAGSIDDGLASARPPEGFEVVRSWTLGSTHELSALRAALQRELAGAQPEQELGRVAQALVLVATELATNGLRHGVPPTTVRLYRRHDAYLLDVADHDLSTTPRIAGERAPGNGGFGLQIARRLSLDVGWYTTELTKHVWARLPAQGIAGGSLHP